MKPQAKIRENGILPGLSPKDQVRYQQVVDGLNPEASFEEMRAALSTLGFTKIKGQPIQNNTAEALRVQLLDIRSALMGSSIYNIYQLAEKGFCRRDPYSK